MRIVSKGQIVAVVFLLAIASRVEPVAASLVASLNPVADSFVTAANPANNYGAAGGLSAAASGLSGGEFDSVMRFDSAAAKSSFDAAFGAGQWTIQAVSLRLTATAPNNAIFNSSSAGQFSVKWMQNDSWVEGTGTPTAPTGTGITFNTLPSFLSGSDSPLGTFNFVGGTSGSATYSLNLPAVFANDLLAGNLVSMEVLSADSTVSYLFNSRNIGVVSSRPELSITAAPEPTSLICLIIAMIPVIRCRRRNGGPFHLA